MTYYGFGPSLREIAASFFAVDPASDGSEDERAPRASYTPVGTPPGAREIDFMIRARATAEQFERAVDVSVLSQGTLLWISKVGTRATRRHEYFVFASPQVFVLDAPVKNTHNEIWTAWLATPFTAYADWWDVLVPQEGEGPFDPSAAVIHARHRVVVDARDADKMSFNLSAQVLAGVRAVSDEYLNAVMTGRYADAIRTRGADGTRLSLGVSVRTGDFVRSTKDPRYSFGRMLRSVASDVTDIAEAYVGACQAERSHVAPISAAASAAEDLQVGAEQLHMMAGRCRALLARVGVAVGECIGVVAVRSTAGLAAGGHETLRLDLGDHDYLELEWETEGRIEVRPFRSDSAPLILCVLDELHQQPLPLMPDRASQESPGLELTNAKGGATIAPDALMPERPIFIVFAADALSN